MFEKYDGVRGFWNPETKSFYSRTGNRFPIPEVIADAMPDAYLDGEIWYIASLSTFKLNNKLLGSGEIAFRRH